MCSSASCRLVIGAPRVDTDDPRALLLRRLQIWHRAGAERAVAGAPAPHQDQLGIDVIGRLASRGLVVGIVAVGHAHREHFGLGRHVRPEVGAAAEHVEKSLRRDPAMQHRLAAGARRVEDRGVAVASRARAASRAPPCPAPRPRRCARTAPSRAARRAASDIAADRDDRCARSGRRRARRPAAADARVPAPLIGARYGRCGRRGHAR